MSSTTLAYVCLAPVASYFVLFLLSFLLDILRKLLSTLHLPWINFLVVQGLGLAFLLYDKCFALSKEPNLKEPTVYPL
jgi:hypothetical protein